MKNNSLNLSLFNRFLNFNVFSDKAEFNKFRLHYKTATFDQVEAFLTDKEVKIINKISNEILEFCSLVHEKYDVTHFLIVFNKVKEYVTVVSDFDFLCTSFNSFNEKIREMSIDDQFDFYNIILDFNIFNHDNNFKRIRNGIVETIFDYELKFNNHTFKKLHPDLLFN
jgi:hypothetical protein